MKKRAGIVAILFLAAACSPRTEPKARAPQPEPKEHRRLVSTPPPTTVLLPIPSRYKALLTIPHLVFSTSADLPGIAPAQDSDHRCDRAVIEPSTSGGKLVVGRGWRVVSEEKLGPLSAVAFVRKTIGLTGAMCAVEDGRIAIFDGANLIAILSTATASRSSIGWLERLTNGTLRVWPSLPEPPIGDLKLVGRTLNMGRTAPHDSICAGKATVPNVFGRSIENARRLMIGAGWTPVRTDPPPELMDEGYHDYFRHGIVEINHCAMDAAGQCLFRYRSAAGEVDLITAQVEWAKYRPVVFYNPDCGAPSDKYDPYSNQGYYSHYP